MNVLHLEVVDHPLVFDGRVSADRRVQIAVVDALRRPAARQWTDRRVGDGGQLVVASRVRYRDAVRRSVHAVLRIDGRVRHDALTQEEYGDLMRQRLGRRPVASVLLAPGAVTCPESAQQGTLGCEWGHHQRLGDALVLRALSEHLAEDLCEIAGRDGDLERVIPVGAIADRCP